MLPTARPADELRVVDLPDEVLIYDLKRHQAHCLNQTAAFVWRRCDGQTSVAQLAALLQADLEGLNIAAAEEMVWLALDRLSRAHLLRERVLPPAVAAGIPRRALLRKVALAVVGGALVLPLVETIVAPTVAMAASCGVACTPAGGTGCAAFPVCNICHSGGPTNKTCQVS